MTREDAYVMCRTCLNYSFPFSNIFKELLGEGYVYEVLMDLCQLEVSSDDGLPEYVCFDCHKNISKLNSFKMQTHESNAALHRFKIKQEIKIEPASCFTSSTPNSGSSPKSTSRTMKECYVRLSRCDQLLQDRYSFKVNIKREKEDPAYLGDNDSGNIQGADMLDSLGSDGEECYLRIRVDQQLPVVLLGEGDSPFASKRASKEKLREETLQANTQGVVKLNEVLCSENLFSNGKEFEGDDIEIHEEKLYSEDAFLKFLSTGAYLKGKSAKEMGNLTSRDGHYLSDGVYLESEHQEIKETSEDRCVTVNVKHGEVNPEDIISRLLERSVQDGVELNLEQSYDEKSVDNGGLKIQEREHLEEMQFECKIFESHNHKRRSSECSGRGIMRESDKEAMKSDNVVSKTYRKISNLLEDSHVQLRKVKNRDLCDIVVCDHCRKEFKEKSDLLKHLVRFKREYTCKRPQQMHETNKDFIRHDEKHNYKACCSIEFIEKTSVMRESDNLHVKYDNIVTKTFRKRGSKDFVCKDSNVQHPEEENGNFLDIIVCDYCREEFHEKSDLLKHLGEHSGRSNFGRLSEKTEGKGNVVLNVSEPTNNIVLYTSDSTNKRGSKKCKRRLRTKNQWKCKWCGKEFAFASFLKYHERLHTGEKPFSCKYCSRKFRMKATLSKHERTHTGVKPFSCSYCSKKFTSLSNLNMHELIHTGVKPYMCEYCSKRFRQKMHLKRHELTHTGVKPFSCKFCSKLFNVKCNLTNHERIHTGVKPYMCKYCSERFRHQVSLKVHERIHTRVLSCS